MNELIKVNSVNSHFKAFDSSLKTRLYSPKNMVWLVTSMFFVYSHIEYIYFYLYLITLVVINIDNKKKNIT